MTTVTQDGSQTVEETEERNPGSPSEPLRVVQRSVTTLRRSGTDTYVTERQVFEPDGNGRLVLVHRESDKGVPQLIPRMVERRRTGRARQASRSHGHAALSAAVRVPKILTHPFRKF